MDMKSKEKKLREFAKSVIDHPEYNEEIRYLLSKLKLSEEEVIQSYVDYDLDVFSYGNEIYEPLAMRVVLHLHNLLIGSWHQERQQIILDMLRDMNPKTAVDMGFGVPPRYIREIVLKEKKPKLTLVDMYDSAFQFAEVLFNFLDTSWKDTISFKKSDMNSGAYIGDFDVYIFQDSIEHVKDPTKYLSKIVKFSPQNSSFLFSLPIGPAAHTHFIEWKDTGEAEKWLDICGLQIKQSKMVHVNPKVDLFAEQLDNKFYNLIVTCIKK